MDHSVYLKSLMLRKIDISVLIFLFRHCKLG